MDRPAFDWDALEQYEDLPYKAWSRRDLDQETQRMRRHKTQEARENMSKAQQKRRQRAR